LTDDINRKILYDSSFWLNSKFHWDFHKNIDEIDQWLILIDKFQCFRAGSVVSEKPQRIPKHIHQIWLGSPVPVKYDRWRRSWLEHNPGYDYTLWDESSLLSLGMQNENAFIKTKNFGAKSDLARYEILNRFGGIYVDTDFECLKSLDEYLLTLDFFCGQVFSDKPELANGIMGAAPNSFFIRLILDSVKTPLLSNDPMTILKEIGSQKITNIFFDNVQLMKNVVVFPSDYFYPWPNFCRLDYINRYSYVTPVSLGLHHWEVSWARGSISLRLLRRMKSAILEALYR
jgi:hypothetical protein